MNTKMNRRRFLGALGFAGGATFAALAVLTPAGADLVPTPSTPPTSTTTLESPAPPLRVSVFGDSITDSAVALARIANAGIDDQMQVSWDTEPGKSTYHFQSGFEAAGVDQPDVVVIATGTNDSVEWVGEVQASWIDNALDALAGNPCVVWVNVRSEMAPHHASWNPVLAEKASAAGNVRVADWDGYSDGHPEWITWDTVHLSDEGKVVYAKWLVEQMQLGCPGLAT